MDAKQILKKNIRALLNARGWKQKDLAQACGGNSPSWLSQIIGNANRNMPLKYLDMIADVFKLEPYQLFQPGLVPEANRRSGQDRRSGHDRRQLRASDLLTTPPSRAEIEDRMQDLSPEAYKVFARRVAWALSEAEPEASARVRRDPQEEAAPPEKQSRRHRAGRPR